MTSIDSVPSKKWLLIFGICIGVFAVSYTTTGIMSALPAISKALGLSNSQAEWAINAYMLGSASLIILGGRLADRFSPRNLFYFGNVGFLIGSLFVAIANDPTLFIVGRVIQGLSVAFVVPNSLTIVKLNFQDENQQKMAIGVWSGIVSLGFSAGPVIAGIIVNDIGWRYVFWANMPITLLSFALCLLVKPVKANKEPMKIDVAGQLTLIIAIFLFALALTESSNWGWSSATTWVVLIMSIVMLVVFYKIEQRVTQPTISFALFHNIRFSLILFLVFITFFSLIGILYVFNLFVQNPLLLHYRAYDAGLAILPTTVAIFVLSFITPKLGNRFGYRWQSVIAFVLLTIGFFLFYQLGLNITYANLWIPLLLIGLGLGGTFPCLPGLALAKLPSQCTAMGASITTFVMYITGIIATAICSSVYFTTTFHHMINKLSGMSGISVQVANEAAKAVITDKSLITVNQQIPIGLQHSVLLNSQISATYAFNNTMLLIALLCLIGAIISLFTLQSKNARSDTHISGQ